jgi:PAS domain S-box-containing protein
MQDEHKSKEQLIDELAALRQRVAESENDIAARRVEQKDLKEPEERFAVIFDNLGDGLLLAEKESKKFLMGNSTIQRMLGCSAEELNRLGVADIHPEQDLPWVIDRFEELARREIEIARDIPVRRNDGSVFYADISCSFPMVFGGKECLMAVFRDISERRQAEDALRESEARYRNIFENATEGIFQSIPEGRYLNVNPAFARLMGFASPEEMMVHISDIGQQIYVHPEDREQLKDLLAEKGKVEGLEVQVRRRDGRIVWISINARVVRDGTGAILYYEGTNQDITERKQAEKALIFASKYNRGLIEASPDPFVAIDFSGTITDVNTAAERVTGYSRVDLIGTDFCDYFTDREKSEVGYQRVFQEGSVADYELELRHSGGKTTPVLFNASVFRDEPGAVVGVFVVARDISVRKQMETALQEVNKDLEQRIEERTLELTIKTRRLEELNTALKVLLEQRDEDREDFEQAILGNAKKLIIPFLEKLKTSGLTSEQTTYLDILELHLNEITSQFVRKLATQLGGLTTTEIQVANLIREGRTTKEIAKILQSSEYTVMFHRYNLRRKLQVKGKKVNLRTYLQSIIE